MITFIRWILMKQKEIKLKLALYSIFDEGIKYISENKEYLEMKFIHELTELIHSQDGRRAD